MNIGAISLFRISMSICRTSTRLTIGTETVCVYVCVVDDGHCANE